MSSKQSQSLDSGTPWSEVEKFVADISAPLDIVGVGNPLRGDDGAGLEVATLLRRRVDHRGGGVKVHVDPRAPERLLSRLAESRHRILVIDAVDASRAPGSVVCARLSDTSFGFFATHNIPLRLIPGISSRAGEVLLVGIQPLSIEFGERLSEPVKAAVSRVVEALSRALEDGK